jgi:ElaB/YqjD/DUF883 family membrane-anchored ribosome-binding protein
MDAAKLKEDVQAASRSIQEGISVGLGRVQETMEQRVRRGADRTQSMFASMNDEFGSFVRESPIVALGGAFAVGYLVAKVARAFR